MKNYCVVYTVCGMHYRYRCSARNKRDAARQCKENMPEFDKIVEIYEE